jgi:hypothetical protein
MRPASNLTLRRERKLKLLTIHSQIINKVQNLVKVSFMTKITLTRMQKTFIIYEEVHSSIYILSLSIRLFEIKHQSSLLKTLNSNTSCTKVMRAWFILNLKLLTKQVQKSITLRYKNLELTQVIFIKDFLMPMELIEAVK